MTRITERVESKKTYTRVSQVICDRCGADMTASEPSEPWIHPLIRGSHFSLSFGYSSRFDMEDPEYDLCDDCCEWLDAQMTRTRLSGAREEGENGS